MPLVPRFLRPPPIRVLDASAPTDPIRLHRFWTEGRRAISAEGRALPDPTPPEDACDTRPIEPDGDQRASAPAPGDEQPCEAPVSAAAENAQPQTALAPRAPAPSRTAVKRVAPVPLPAPADDTERRALRKQARAMPAEAAFISDTLRLARLCWRTGCRKADACRGDAHMCLDSTGESVPAEAYAWAVLLAQARQDGEPADELEAMYPEEALAYRCWIAALEALAER